MVVDGTKGDSRAYHVLALVTKRQKAGDEGKPEALSASIANTDCSDVKMSEVPPRWPPVLPKGPFEDATWEVTAVEATSIAFVVDRILKVRVRCCVCRHG